MTDWNLVAKIAGGGYGIAILVLIILAVIAWTIGLVAKKTQPANAEVPQKEK